MTRFLKILFAVFAVLFFVSTSFAFGNKEFYSTDNPSLAETGEGKQNLNKDNLNIVAKIDEAKRILQNQKVNYKICSYKKRVWIKKRKHLKKKVITVKYLCNTEYLLAVSSAEKNEIKILRFKDKEKQTDDENFWIEMGKPNGVATSFIVKYPLGYIVLAVKRILKKSDGIKSAIYTPYSKELNLSPLRKEGLNYLEKIIQNAAQKINNCNIKSALSGEKLVIENEWIRIAKTLAINEHIDPLEYIKIADINDDSKDSSLTELIEKVLITLGANRETAYKYSVSTAFARNLFQHIPSTYKYVLNNYPSADLKSDFIEGMNDHENAAVATFCLFNTDLYVLKNQNIDLKQSPETLRKLIASSYNCGAERTTKTIKKYGENWVIFLPMETQIYLKKFDFVWNFLNSIEDFNNRKP